jgi:hypothetical protein
MPRPPVPKPLFFPVADKQKDLTEFAQALGKLVPTQDGLGCSLPYIPFIGRPCLVGPL